MGVECVVQATLLGVSIAIILALLTALVGPYFVDWSGYRTVFEAQASRLIGAPVHVDGPIDVRLLPTPSLVLRQVEAGSPNEPAGPSATPNICAVDQSNISSLQILMRPTITPTANRFTLICVLVTRKSHDGKAMPIANRPQYEEFLVAPSHGKPRIEGSAKNRNGRRRYVYGYV